VQSFGQVCIDAQFARPLDACARIELVQREPVPLQHGLRVLAQLLQTLNHVDQAKNGSGAHVDSGQLTGLGKPENGRFLAERINCSVESSMAASGRARTIAPCSETRP